MTRIEEEKPRIDVYAPNSIRPVTENKYEHPAVEIKRHKTAQNTEPRNLLVMYHEIAE